MAKIKVIRGACGIKYAGNRYKTVTAADGYLECDDTLAARLVRLGVAEYQKADAEDTEVQLAESDQEPEKAAGHLDAEQLAAMTNDQLKALAAEMGVDVSGCKKKADYIAAIVAVEAEADAEDGDELPQLGAADPE